ncbi:hypothetical protein NDU88_002979 [Pleurodeles waltl]|uniref:Uncharacterized protein n=1 Tax=Pleurodeles waltl TaxID=8319 RepID=A0AAV7UC32_PLEWA|nr:hypothetical protein NDU88_002979 [Pleurodeles waltl]
MDYHIFKQQDGDSDNQDESHKSEGGEKKATAAQEGSEEGGDRERRRSRKRDGSWRESPSEVDVQEETPSLDEVPDAWSEEWNTPQEDAGELRQLTRVAA